jgi:AraC-like DNA-binding protein
MLPIVCTIFTYLKIMPKPFLENVEIDHSASIKAAAYVQNLIDVPLHYHPEHEIVFILSGRGKVYLAGAETEFRGGQLFFIGGKVPHLFEDEGLVTGKKKTSKVVVIQFTEKLFESLWLLPEFEKIKYFLSKISCGIKVSGIKNKSHFILDLLDAKGVEKINMMITLLNHIVENEKYQIIAPDEGQSAANNPAYLRLQKMNLYLSVNYSREVKIENVAQLLNLGKTSLCRFLKKETGKTFSEHVNRFRIHHACKMLRESGRNVTQVCYDVGFNNEAYFYRQFKKLQKKSPLEYKLNHMNT